MFSALSEKSLKVQKKKKRGSWVNYHDHDDVKNRVLINNQELKKRLDFLSLTEKIVSTLKMELQVFQFNFLSKQCWQVEDTELNLPRFGLGYSSLFNLFWALKIQILKILKLN